MSDENDETVINIESYVTDKQRETMKVISAKLAQARALIKECEDLADETGTPFNVSYAGGGWNAYWPKAYLEQLNKLDEDGGDRYELNEYFDTYGGEYGGDYEGWQNSYC